MPGPWLRAARVLVKLVYRFCGKGRASSSTYQPRPGGSFESSVGRPMKVRLAPKSSSVGSRKQEAHV